MSADWWQNFANNFAADLAPLLSLFGEQPTKQFLSETLDLVDIVIFSIAPIGVLTAVVSAIRVSGDPSLRAFIGRAQEGGAYAEAELCSSTSRDVCELYTTGGIARVFGRPKILEVVHDPYKGQGPKTASKDQDPEPAGIYLFEDYLNLGEDSSEWTEKKMATQKSFAIHPNLSLNIGIKRLSRPWFYLAATLGLLLQGGVLVFAAIATYVYPDTFKRDDSQIAVPAFPFTLIGTILLCSGIGLCAAVVERSTKERVFKRNKNSKCRLHWVQPGGQVIGDQVFDSFAYSENSDNPLKEYTTSWKPDDRTTKHGMDQATKMKTLSVRTAIVTTCVGFVLQFLGIRTLHPSVSVAQFVVMLVMSTVRALLRTQRLKKSDNLMGDSYTLYQGHELDWLSIKLAWSENDGGDRGWTWQIVRPFEGFSYEAVDISQKIPGDSRNYGLPADTRPGLEQAFLKRARLARLTGSQSPNHTSIAYSSWDITMIASRELASSLANAIEGAMALFYSECTIETSWKKANKICWTIPCGEEIIRKRPRGPKSENELVTESSCIRFTLSRQIGSTENSWRADKSELEAALGLWFWSIRLKDRVESPGEQISEGCSASFIPRSRIVLFHEETNFSAKQPTPPAEDSAYSGEDSTDSLEDSTTPVHTSIASVEASDFFTRNPPFPAEQSSPVEANLKLWLGSRRLTLRQTTLRLPPHPLGPSNIVTPLKEYKEEIFSETSPDGHEKEMTKPKPRRLFGYHIFPKCAIVETEVRVLEIPSQSSLEMMCAQEIFSAFLMSLMPIVQQIDGKISIIKGFDKVHLENQTLSNMMRNFVTSGIGSEEDALTCIVPVLHGQGKLKYSMVFNESKDAANAYRRRNEWVNAEQVLLCALSLSFQVPESFVIQYGPGKYTKYTKEQNMCLLALCELYRWALHGDRNSRLFGLRGILSICKTHNFERFSKEIFDYRAAVYSLCCHYKDDPAIQKLLEELQAEVRTGRKPYGLSRDGQLKFFKRDLQDEDFPQFLAWGQLGPTLYLLKDKVFRFCHDQFAIALAAENGWVTVLEALLELGADPEEIDQDGRNYLHSVLRSTIDPETFLQLVGNQSYLLNRTEKRGRTFLHLAAEANLKEIAGILIDKFSLDPYQWDLSMKSPLDLALDGRREKTSAFAVTKMVQKLGLSSSNIMWDTLMQVAMRVAEYGDQDFLDSFIRYLDKERSDSRNENIRKVLDGLRGSSDTLFQEFAETECFEFAFLESTFREHFDHDQKLSRNFALSCKAKVNNISMELEKVASLDDAGRSCLHYAIKGGDPTRIQELLNADPGIDVNAEDRTGRTPLAYAFWNGNMELISLLQKHGAGMHRLPLEGSAIAAAATPYGCHLYFQDKEQKIREMLIEDGTAKQLKPEIAVARRSTPLAVIERGNCNRKFHVYYISTTEDYLCETVVSGKDVFDGRLNHRKIKVYRRSRLAALKTNAGILWVFYQDTSGDLQEIRSSDGSDWESPKRIGKAPLGTVFTALMTPEGITRIIFQGETCPEEIYENNAESNTEWKQRDFIKVRLRWVAEKIQSITALSQPSRKDFWLGYESHMHETTLSDDGHWENSTDVDFANTEQPYRRYRRYGIGDKLQSQICAIGSEPTLFYQKEDGYFFRISKGGNSWCNRRMVIPVYDS